MQGKQHLVVLMLIITLLLFTTKVNAQPLDGIIDNALCYMFQSGANDGKLGCHLSVVRAGLIVVKVNINGELWSTKTVSVVDNIPVVITDSPLPWQDTDSSISGSICFVMVIPWCTDFSYARYSNYPGRDPNTVVTSYPYGGSDRGWYESGLFIAIASICTILLFCLFCACVCINRGRINRYYHETFSKRLLKTNAINT